MKYLGKMTISIMDRDWRVFFCTSESYARIGPAGSKAVANTEKRTIHFDCSTINKNDGVAVHELVHVYSFELLGHDTPQEGLAQQEEFFCNVFERRGADILAKARPITARLMYYKKRLAKTQTKEDKDAE